MIIRESLRVAAIKTALKLLNEGAELLHVYQRGSRWGVVVKDHDGNILAITDRTIDVEWKGKECQSQFSNEIQ